MYFHRKTLGKEDSWRQTDLSCFLRRDNSKKTCVFSPGQGKSYFMLMNVWSLCKRVQVSIHLNINMPVTIKETPWPKRAAAGGKSYTVQLLHELIFNSRTASIKLPTVTVTYYFKTNATQSKSFSYENLTVSACESYEKLKKPQHTLAKPIHTSYKAILLRSAIKKTRQDITLNN